MVYIILIISAALSAGWLKLWISTYLPRNIGGYIKHTVIFTMLSLLIAWLAAQIIFAPADDTYSAANKSALGMIFMLWLIIFGSVCLIAVIVTLGSFIESKTSDKRSDKDEK